MAKEGRSDTLFYSQRTNFKHLGKDQRGLDRSVEGGGLGNESGTASQLSLEPLRCVQAARMRRSTSSNSLVVFHGRQVLAAAAR